MLTETRRGCLCYFRAFDNSVSELQRHSGSESTRALTDRNVTGSRSSPCFAIIVVALPRRSFRLQMPGRVDRVRLDRSDLVLRS